MFRGIYFIAIVFLLCGSLWISHERRSLGEEGIDSQSSIASVNPDVISEPVAPTITPVKIEFQRETPSSRNEVSPDDSKEPTISQLQERFQGHAGDPHTEALAEKLAKAEPNSYPTAKALVISRFLHLTDPKHGSMTNEELESVQNALSHAEELDRTHSKQGDDELLDMKIGFTVLESVKQHRSWQEISDQIEQVGRTNPESSTVAYFQAYTQCRRGNRRECLDWLQQSVNHTHNDWQKQSRLQLMAQVRQGNVVGAPFVIQMSNRLSAN